MSDIEMAHPRGNHSLAQVATSSPPQEQQRQEITDAAPATPPAAEEAVHSSAQDVNTSPPQERQEITVAHISPEAVDEIIRRYKSFPKSKSEELDDLRGWLMLLATLTASIAWNASLNPPGGVWQADDVAKGYVAGGSVFRDKNRGRYRLFEIFNMASFFSSLLMLILLSNSWLFRRTNAWVFSVLVSLDLVALLATFILGDSVTVKASPLGIGMLIAYLSFSFLGLAYIIGIRPRD